MSNTVENLRNSLTDALENALAHQRFEGLSPYPETVRDLELVIDGKLTFEDVIANIGSHSRNVQIRR
jgi:phenylalanyl-tRNA synthetase beta subunit